MSVNCCPWIYLLKRCHQFPQRLLLLWRPCVHRCKSVLGTAADVANAYRMCIMPGAMGADKIDVPPFMHTTVQVYHIVIAYGLEAACLVPSDDVFHMPVLAYRRRCAMHNNLRNLTATLRQRCRWCQSVPGFRSDNAVNCQPVLVLKHHHRLFRDGTEHSVVNQMQHPLQHLHIIPYAALLQCFHYQPPSCSSLNTPTEMVSCLQPSASKRSRERLPLCTSRCLPAACV